jgi:hypothetical protein
MARTGTETRMNTVLENLMVALNDELQFCFKEHFGTNIKEWAEIDIYETMQIVIAQGSSRFTVGLPLCKPVLFRSSLHPLTLRQAEQNSTYDTTFTWEIST